MKILILALTLRTLVFAAEPVALSRATTEERLAIAEKSNALLNQEIVFEEKRIAGLQAQIQSYEKALLEPATAAKQAVDIETAKAAKAHSADGCQLRADGAWEKCPAPRK